jgi:hypothetical protein
MRRTLLGIAMLLHGLAHANAGLLAANDGSLVATMLWATASVGFLAAGVGLVGVRRLTGDWRAFGMAAAGCSVLLLATYRSTFLPQYAVFPPLWLVVLLAGRFRERGTALGLLTVAWLVLTLTVAGRARGRTNQTGMRETLERVKAIVEA